MRKVYNSRLKLPHVFDLMRRMVKRTIHSACLRLSQQDQSRTGDAKTGSNERVGS